MTTAQVLKYLRSQATEVDNTALTDVAQVALETAYNDVWGSYRWTHRRAQSTLTLTASGATTDLPKDFERGIWMSLQESGKQRAIVMKPEEWFELHHPFPAAESEGTPTVCKVVYAPGSDASDWKAYWWRIPNEAFSVVLAYDRRGNVGGFDQLPSYMTSAVIAGALALVKGNLNERMAFDSLYEKSLARAQSADKAVSGVYPLFGDNLGYDDFDSGLTSAGDTNDPLDLG
jgi:hypothetical protein